MKYMTSVPCNLKEEDDADVGVGGSQANLCCYRK